MSKVENLLNRMKTMTDDDLIGYLGSVNFIRRCCTIAGISAILLILITPAFYTYFIAAVTLYVLGKTAVHADNTRSYILGLLIARAKEKHK